VVSAVVNEPGFVRVQALTRIVAQNESMVPTAVKVINLATLMMNKQFKPEKQQQQQQAGDAAAGEQQPEQQQQEQQQRVLVFQPLKVRDYARFFSSSCSCYSNTGSSTVGIA
jgi:hypothetical protein